MFSNYMVPPGLRDEVFSGPGIPRHIYHAISAAFIDQGVDSYQSIHAFSKDYLRKQGISFVVYNNQSDQKEDIFPLDLFPRAIGAKEWERLERGMLQRNRAINLFLKDIYNAGHILKDQVVPYEMVLSSPGYNREMENFLPPDEVYTHVCGTDMIQDERGEWLVLEDNVRNPSGVSYVLSNREIMKILYGGLLKKTAVRQVSDYTDHLYRILASVSPHKNNPCMVLLTPGVYNSAYFEHGFLARNMGIQLVEGRDLFVDQKELYMKTIKGREKIHVLYRRIDDDYLDPLTFKPDSIIGIPGLMQAYRAHKVTLANAPGCGAADDKAIYPYLPEIIKYYLQEDPIIANVPTYFANDPVHMKYIEENIEQMVIKPVNMSGGYGIMMGHQMSKGVRDAQILKMKHHPRDYIAQPIIKLSTHATYIESGRQFEPRHVDLRIFTLMGKDTSHVLKGGLTRVALPKDSLIVNSSQGGGSKDTWVLTNDSI